MESAMTSWQTEAGHLSCRWSEVGQHAPYNPVRMQEPRNVPSSYLTPIPDFASHSPFGGTEEWFRLHCSKRKVE
jgi:hypothetical protein